MRIGFTKQKFIFPKSCHLAGYAANRPMDGILDDLYVKVFVIEQNDCVYALAVFDLIAIDHLVMERIRLRLQDHSIQIDHLACAATHTHSAVMGVLNTRNSCLRSAVDVLGKPKEEVVEECVEKAVQAIRRAFEALDEGKLHIFCGSAHGIGANRISKSLEGNDQLLLVEACTSTKKALLTLFACHPTILPPSNCFCSADLPGAYAKYMEQHYDLSIYLNGSCGDISTRFTRMSSDVSELDRLSRLLYEQAFSALNDKQFWNIETMTVKRFQVTLQAKRPIPIAQARSYVAQCSQKLMQAKQDIHDPHQLRLMENALEGAQADLRYAMAYDGTLSYDIPITMFHCNDEIFIGVPGELFSQLSNRIQDAHTHFISYFNGYTMYFANESAYEQHNYEALSSPFEKGESEYMMKQIETQIKKWRKQ